MAHLEKSALGDTGRQRGVQHLPGILEDSTDVFSGGDVRVAAAGGKTTFEGEDILDLEDLDPALNMKMHLVNNVGEIREREARIAEGFH